MCANHAVFPYVGNGEEKMGKCLESSFETSSCSMIPLLPANPVKLESVLVWPETANRIGKSEKKDAAYTELDDKVTPAGHTGMENRRAAKEAVIFMGLPETLVQLVIDMGPVDPSLTFTNAEQLYELVEGLLSDPKRQADLVKKHYEHQKASRASSTNVAEPRRGREEPGVLSTHAKADDRQQLPTGMSEGSCQSARAAVASSSTSPSSSSATSTSGCSLSKMMRNPPEAAATSGDACKQNAGSVRHEAAPKSPTSSSSTTTAKLTELPTTSLTTSAQHLEENVDQNPPQDTVSSTPKTPSKEQLRSRVRRLAEENWRLTQRKLCRSCKEVELSSSGVTFLPCGHFITCEGCSEKFDDCPACGKMIMGTVRTFLS